MAMDMAYEATESAPTMSIMEDSDDGAFQILQHLN